MFRSSVRCPSRVNTSECMKRTYHMLQQQLDGSSIYQVPGNALISILVVSNTFSALNTLSMPSRVHKKWVYFGSELCKTVSTHPPHGLAKRLTLVCTRPLSHTYFLRCAIIVPQASVKFGQFCCCPSSSSSWSSC